jgi:hypothetical protein
MSTLCFCQEDIVCFDIGVQIPVLKLQIGGESIKIGWAQEVLHAKIAVSRYAGNTLPKARII